MPLKTRQAPSRLLYLTLALIGLMLLLNYLARWGF